jgi:hypothetical protein
MNRTSLPLRPLGLIAASALWAALPRLLPRAESVAWGLPLYALLLVVILLACDRAWLRPRLALTRRALLIGVAGGVLVTAVTYPVFSLASGLYPELAARVASDYALLATTSPAAYWPRLCLVVFAEELLFRGSWLKLAPMSSPAAQEAGAFGVLPAALALTSYVVVQIGWGSFAVPLAAAFLGAVLLLQAHLSQGIVAPFITHLTWSTVVLLLHPVTG